MGGFADKVAVRKWHDETWIVQEGAFPDYHLVLRFYRAQ
jgi:hypothetical protein